MRCRELPVTWDQALQQSDLDKENRLDLGGVNILEQCCREGLSLSLSISIVRIRIRKAASHWFNYFRVC